MGKTEQYIARDEYITGKTIIKNKKTTQIQRQRSLMERERKRFLNNDTQQDLKKNL